LDCVLIIFCIFLNKISTSYSAYLKSNWL